MVYNSKFVIIIPYYEQNLCFFIVFYCNLMNKAELEEWREHLLRYCELDTFAMVKVLEKLKEAVK